MKLFNLMETAYDSFDNTVRKYLSRAFDSLGLNSNHTSIFMLIYDGIKGVMQNAMFYIEDALTEQNIFTATRKKSVYSLAKISGYEPYYGSAAVGTLIATVIRGQLLDSDSHKIFIPNYTVILERESSTRYILQLNTNEHVIDITKPLVSHEFKVIEGTAQKNYFTAAGNNFETFSVQGGTALFDKSNIEVFVNGIKFTEAASMYDMIEGENEYVISIGYDATFQIMFGDGIYGNKLNEGDSVTIYWISHHGEKGNILGTANTNFIFETAGRDTYGNVVNLNKFVKLNMQNCISGGTNSDSIGTIRNMIGYNSRSLVLATTDNFKLFLKRFSFIGRVNCWSHENTMQMIISCLSNKITDIKSYSDYYTLNVNDLYVSNDQKEQILTALTNSNRMFAGISIQFIDPKIWRYAAICILKLTENYNKDSIKEKIKKILGEYFINIPEDATVIYKSDIIKEVLNNCSELTSFDIQFISEKGEVAYYTKAGYQVVDVQYRNGQLIPKYITRINNSADNNGLDKFGNILIESKLEVPILQGGFKYYNKNDNKADTQACITIDTLQFIFL